jgi:hypothetical protein
MPHTSEARRVLLRAGMTRCASLATTVAILALSACAGRVETSSSASPDQDGGPHSNPGREVEASACPTAKPTLGASCLPTSGTCDYGGCDQLVCLVGRWQGAGHSCGESAPPPLPGCFSEPSAKKSAKWDAAANELALTCVRDADLGLETTRVTLVGGNGTAHYAKAKYARSYAELDRPEFAGSPCELDLVTPSWPVSAGDRVHGKFNCPLVQGNYVNGTSGSGTFTAGELFDVLGE